MKTKHYSILSFVLLIFFLKLFAPKFLFDLGVKHEKKGEGSNALFCYDIANFIDWSNAKYRFQRGRMLMYGYYFAMLKENISNYSYINYRYQQQKAKFDLIVETDLKKAIELDPTHIDAFLALGSYYKYKLEFNESYRLFDGAINIDKKNPIGYFGRGICAHGLKKYDDALLDYNFIIKNIDLNSPLFVYNLNFYDKVKIWEVFVLRAKIYIETGKIDEAIADLNQAINFEPKSEKLLFQRGKLKAKKGDFVDAIKDYDKIFELGLEFIDCYFARAEARNAIGDIKGANEDIKNGKKIQEDLYKGRAGSPIK